MSSQEEVGQITWMDLTVPDAQVIRDFYRDVVGWNCQPVDMGDYEDFNMVSPQTGKPAAGICHARGVNAELPAQWLIYITVDSVEKSVERTVALGGKVLVPPKSMGNYGMYCVVQDPAGAVAALIEQP
ncbi:MAG: VOC family protein [Ignavibacteriae bacterium]|nr:VOC family protein [Ignavibacteriota bacterium]